MAYDVYGLGNALVDREYAVGDDILTALQLEKGLASLIDAPQLEKTIALLDASASLRGQAGGGSVANSLIALQQFGGSTAFACRVADDKLGLFYQEDLKRAGTSLDSSSKEGITGQCLVLVSDDAERTMMTYLGASAELDASSIDAEKIKSSQYLYIEGYLAPLPNAVDAVKQATLIAHNAGVKIALTFSDPSMTRYCKDGLIDMLGKGVDVLFCNEEEALAFTEQSDLSGALDALSHIAPHVVVTQGAQGVSILHDGTQTHVATQAVTAIDSTGAGDMFAGAYLYGLTQNWPIEQCAQLANKAAAAVVQKHGPRLSQLEQDALVNNLA